MGARGPQPRPSKVLKLAGNWRAGERERTELKVKSGAPAAPAWLGAAAKAEWRRVIAALLAVRLVTPQDRAMLVVHCHAWGEFEQAVKDLEAIETWMGVPTDTPDLDARTRKLLLTADNSVGHPRVVMNRAAERLMKTADRFGMSAAARARLNAGEGEGEKDKQQQPQGKARFFPDGPATRAG